jgi:hypothetical protein
VVEYRYIGRAFELQDISVCLRCGALVHPSYEDTHTAEHERGSSPSEPIR